MADQGRRRGDSQSDWAVGLVDQPDLRERLHLREVFGPICGALNATNCKFSPLAKERPAKPGWDRRSGNRLFRDMHQRSGFRFHEVGRGLRYITCQLRWFTFVPAGQFLASRGSAVHGDFAGCCS